MMYFVEDVFRTQGVTNLLGNGFGILCSPLEISTLTCEQHNELVSTEPGYCI